MQPNIPESNLPRVVIIGGGFAGLKIASGLKNKPFQVVLLDKNNFHQFQPLFYQVATSGLEPSAIAFPFRKIFQHFKHFHFRETLVKNINTKEQILDCSVGQIHYDYLVIATGTDTNFYKIDSIQENGLPMKTVAEALKLRNTILENFEYALVADNADETSKNLDIVIVGGGPTGVELAGALADLRNDVLPKDYPEIDFSKMNIRLIEAGTGLLASMSPKASLLAEKYLKQLNVEVQCSTSVKSFSNHEVLLSNEKIINAKTLIWAAGVTANTLNGLAADAYGPGNRLKVNDYNQINGFENIFAIGDVSIMQNEMNPKGHPQVAQVAIQQANLLTKNLLSIENKQALIAFKYKNKGSMATIGRNLAVVDLPFWSFGGFFAWLIWMFVHLMSIVGVKNRFFIFINWTLNYFTRDQSLRLIIRTKPKQSFS
ncbi:MAG: NAD(P)/FAD-dependent oxidoreductase [bacterium]|nr:NAD(P)/FAD-dependent oxidoreductase [bacterium]